MQMRPGPKFQLNCYKCDLITHSYGVSYRGDSMLTLEMNVHQTACSSCTSFINSSIIVHRQICNYIFLIFSPHLYCPSSLFMQILCIRITIILYSLSFYLNYSKLTIFTAYGTQRFIAAFTKALK